MSSKREARSFSLLHSDFAETEFHFELVSSIFLSATGERGKCTGFFLPNADVGSKKFLDLAKQAASKVASNGERVVWKLIGTPEVIELAENALRSESTYRFERRPRMGDTEIIFIPAQSRVRAASLPSSAPVAARVPGEEARAEAIHTEKGRTRVLIVDDSATIRNLLQKILSEDPGIEIIGSAGKPSEAESFLRSCPKGKLPHVITLDIHMPEMDGVSFLKSYLPKYPIPTVMISSISLEEGPLVLSALESGAVDYIQKPSFDQIALASSAILEKVKHARFCKVHLKKERAQASLSPVRTSGGKSANQVALDNRGTLIAIGSSTGGTEALREIFVRLPAEIPPIVVTQHIPPFFSKAFARRMDDLCPFEVKEAEDGDALLSNRILIAPGNTQMSIIRSGSTYRIRVDPNAPETNRHKPSVDVLFESVAPLFGARAIGIILTGMGADGAKGLLKMRQSGAKTLGQDESSCVVYGMPRAAMEIGAVERQLSLDEIANAITVGFLSSSSHRTPKSS